MRLQQITRAHTGRHPNAIATALPLCLVAAIGLSLPPLAATSQQAVAEQSATAEQTAGGGVLIAADAGTVDMIPTFEAPAFAAKPKLPSLDDLMPGARMTSGFGMRRDPINGNRVHHDGVDLTTGKQAPVYAPRGGMVELVEQSYGDQGRMGTVVIINHGGGVKTFYAHLESASVEVGSGVMAGDRIGESGSTGASTGPHLHFEIWQDGKKIDPTMIGEAVGNC